MASKQAREDALQKSKQYTEDFCTGKIKMLESKVCELELTYQLSMNGKKSSSKSIKAVSASQPDNVPKNDAPIIEPGSGNASKASIVKSGTVAADRNINTASSPAQSTL